MIDWLTISIPFEHPTVNGGRLLKTDSAGCIEWECRSKLVHRGTYSSAIAVRSEGAVPGRPGWSDRLFIDGNLTKFLQGHNVCGPDCVATIVTEAFVLLCRELGIPYSVFDVYRVSRGAWDLKRIDITYSFRVGYDDLAVDNFLAAVGDTASTKYRRAHTDRGTAYFNKGSRRWSSAWYNKAKEMKKHKPPMPDHVRCWLYARSGSCRPRSLDSRVWGQLVEAIRGCVRVEFRLLSLQLKDMSLSDGSFWCSSFGRSGRCVYDVWCEMMSRISVSGNVRLSGDKLADLPGPVRGTYELWRSGVSVRELLSRATFYRHKKILREHGIDLDAEIRETATVIPIVRYLEAHPERVSIPADAAGLLRAVG